MTDYKDDTMGRIIAIANQKGGVGKTTTVINLSACLAEAGQKVLAVDFDPQGNATSGLGFEKGYMDKTVYELLVGECTLEECIIKEVQENLDVLPSDVNLAGAEIELLDVPNKESLLRTELGKIKNDYDYVIIDCPPSLSLLTINALTAADTIDAVWTQGPMTGVIEAFTDAGKDVPVIVGGGYGVYNGDALSMLEGNYDGLVWLSGMPGMSAVAIYEAYSLLCGEEVEKNNILNDLYFCSNNSDKISSINDITVNPIEEGVNCWKAQEDSFGWPVVPSDFCLQPEIEDIFG